MLNFTVVLRHPDSVPWITANNMELFWGARFAIEKWILKLVECSHDLFWLLDKFLILAGARFTPRNRCQRIGWILYRILACPQPPIALLCFVSAVVFEEDSATVVRNLAVFSSFSLSLIKQRLLSQKFGGILTIRGLLEASDFCSGNSDLDESVRKRFKRTSRTIIITITSIITVQQIVCWIPSEPRDIIFGIPQWIALCWGEKFEQIAGHMLYLCARLPYSEDHHKDYLDMRVTLQIIALCSRNAVSFGCAGVSEISVKVFAEMLNNCYSVFTFLREMI
ncbi:conserved hypothetical protein [Culex quinquefasciatus]|uniref:Odorant receptor n=1 Tax=Culex quinquefasciatus TaxID=7176 RepID=B0X7S6_CULQU|nr:conserved hypothetical protein [Culex quinquefasciatus]|eukprot:XP_001865698.1 conserved hypothetical protein [Culex quinquefasciatus]